MPNHHVKRLRERLNSTLRGKESVIDNVLACLLARGHVLIEDLPGLGKTTLAKALQFTMAQGDWRSPLLMAGVSLPAYAPPLKVMMMLGLMFDHGNSIGAAYVLLVLGAGMNIGLLAWLAANFGVPRTAVWLAAVAAIALAIGYTVENPLYRPGRSADHTHAFDDFSAPFHYGFGGAASGQVWMKLTEHTGLGEVASLITLGLLGIIGLAARYFHRPTDIATPAATLDSPAVDPPFWNRPMSPRTLTLLSLSALAVFAVVAAYIYYPSPDIVFKQMLAVHAEAADAVRQGRVMVAQRELRIWDDLTRKLEVGVYIRKGSLTSEQAESTHALREVLEEIFDALGHGDVEHAREHLPELSTAYLRCRSSYADRSSDP